MRMRNKKWMCRAVLLIVIIFVSTGCKSKEIEQYDELYSNSNKGSVDKSGIESSKQSLESEHISKKESDTEEQEDQVKQEYAESSERSQTYSMYRQIDKSGPFYLFEFVMHEKDDVDNTNEFSDMIRSVEVFVREQDGTIVDEFEIDDVWEFHPTKYYVTDINFDGFNDILMLASNYNAKANHDYYGLLWSEDHQSYEFVTMPWPNLAIDRENEQLLTIVANSAASHTYSMYRFEDEEAVLTNDLTINIIHPDDYEEYGISVNEEEESKDYWLFEEYALEDGELVCVNELVSTPDDELRDKIVELYYSDDSIWQLNGLKFYRSDYGEGLGFYDEEGNDIDLHMDLGYEIEEPMANLKNELLTIIGGDEADVFINFALIDFDNDRIPEVIITKSDGDRLVLKYEEGSLMVVQSIVKNEGDMSFKKDGTIQYLSDTGEPSNDYRIAFYWGEAEIEELIQQGDEIETDDYGFDAIWYDCTIDKIEAVFSNIR